MGSYVPVIRHLFILKTTDTHVSMNKVSGCRLFSCSWYLVGTRDSKYLIVPGTD